MEKATDQSRRNFLGKSTAAAAAAFTIVKPNLVRGAGPASLRGGLIGCGGRGTQAVADLLTGNQNVQIVAMADMYEDKLEDSIKRLREDLRVPFPRYVGAEVIRNGEPYHLTRDDVVKSIQDGVQVDPALRFTGPDAYKSLIASDVDFVMIATPGAYRPLHFEAVVNAGKHAFCEKPFATDCAGAKRFMAAARKSEELGLTVLTGAQRRFDRSYVETIDQLQSGALGDVVALKAYWMGTPVIQAQQRDPSWSDFEFQHRCWYSFCWICGDQIVEQHLHNIDVCNWLMGTHPVKVRATGGAAWRPREEIYGNIYDHLSAEFEYPNGVIMTSNCRQIAIEPGIYDGRGELALCADGRSNCQDLAAPANDPYFQEHIEFLRSIRQQRETVNHALEVANSTMTCIMGREAAYSGRDLTWTDVMLSDQNLMPNPLSPDAPIPVPPLPVPGEYQFS